VQHHVGEDDRQRDRDQRLAQLLAEVPAQEHLLDREAQHGHAERGDERRQPPVGDAGREFESDVAPEEVQGAVRQVHDSHQAEDQREPAGADEVEAGQRDAVQPDDHELGHVSRLREARAEGLVGHPGDCEQEGGQSQPRREVAPDQGWQRQGRQVVEMPVRTGED
jgi:hypothetical protein